MKEEYRIREDVIEVCNGYSCRLQRCFIAERRRRFLLLSFWWPVLNGEWRRTEAEAMSDIMGERELRKSKTIRHVTFRK